MCTRLICRMPAQWWHDSRCRHTWVMTAASSGRLSTTLKSSWLDSRPHAGTLMSKRSTSYDFAHRFDGGWDSLRSNPVAILGADEENRLTTQTENSGDVHRLMREGALKETSVVGAPGGAWDVQEVQHVVVALRRQLWHL